MATDKIPLPAETPMGEFPDDILAVAIEQVSEQLRYPWIPGERRVLMVSTSRDVPGLMESLWDRIKIELTKKGWPVHNEYEGFLQWLTLRPPDKTFSHP